MTLASWRERAERDRFGCRGGATGFRAVAPLFASGMEPVLLGDLCGDGGDAHEESTLDRAGVEHLVEQAGGGARDVHRGAGQDRVVAVELKRLQRSAVEAEQVGLGRGDLAIDGDVTVQLR